MNPFALFFANQGFVMLDGAFATELERHGANLDDPLWSARCLLESPELVYRVHMDYLKAGADVIASATYQASQQGFEARGLSAAEARSLMVEGVRIAQRARDDFWSVESNRAGRLRPLVAASMGPFGACLHDGSEYHGNYAAGWAKVRQFHRARVAILVEAGADLLAFETIPSLPEAEVLIDVLAEFPDQAAWISFSCRDGSHVSHGEAFGDCARLACVDGRLAAVGINCTAPHLLGSLLEHARGLRCPIIVYPNSGEKWVAGGNRWEGQCDSSLDPRAWYEAGARIIGGCCRTGPADIARMRAALSELASGAAPVAR